MFSLSAIEMEALLISLKVALVGTGLSLAPGIAIAWLIARRRFPGRLLLDGIVHLPLVLPPVVTGYLLLLVLGRRGAIGAFLYEHLGIRLAFDWKGAAIVAAITGFPLLVRAVRLSLEAADENLEWAARTLGASAFGTFFSITLPLIMPGIIAGALLAFARALGEFGATITFAANIPGETQTLPLLLYSLLQSPDSETLGLRIVLLSLGLAAGALFFSEFLARKAQRRLRGEE